MWQQRTMLTRLFSELSAAVLSGMIPEQLQKHMRMCSQNIKDTSSALNSRYTASQTNLPIMMRFVTPYVLDEWNDIQGLEHRQ